MLMLLYNRAMQKDAKSIRVGFTIIEVMLFLALTGLLLSGVLIGLGSNISRQRYNDAVEDIADILQNQYSFVSDVHINMRTKAQDSSCYALVSKDISDGSAAAYYNSVTNSMSESISYRGRTNCVVYGAVVVIDGASSKIQTSELIGRDYITMVRLSEEPGGTPIPDNYNDLKILKDVAKANNIAVHCPHKSDTSSCYIRAADHLTTRTLKWGVKMVDETNNTLKATLLIFRSPRDGSIRTYVWKDYITNDDGNAYDYEEMNGSNSGNGLTYASSALDRFGINDEITDANFKNDQDLKICIETGSAQIYDNHKRMIKILHNGSGQSAIRLVDADDEADQCQD